MAEWPPFTVTALPDPSGTDPLGSYPLLDPVIVTERVAATSATTSPENRVTEYLDSRTETLRVLLNDVLNNFNAVQDHFIHRDGDQHVRTDTLTAAVGTITLSNVPNDADSVTINDGLGETETFEFDNNTSVTLGNVLVSIGGTATATASNLMNAINAITTLQVTATKGPDGEVRLVHDVPGSLANQPITNTDTASVQTLAGMSGGLNEEVVNDPSYATGPLDLGGFKIVNLADAVNVGDLITMDQYNEVLFTTQDDVEQVLDNLLVRRDGATQMGAQLQMGGHRITDLSLATQPDNLERRTEVDTQSNTFTTGFINLQGTNAMTADLDMQDQPTDPRYKITDLGDPTADGDIVNLQYLTEQLDLVGANSVPVAAVMPFAGFHAGIAGPFLRCDGSEVSRTQYQALFLVIGVTYGSPSNSNVFKLPDLRGRVMIGMDSMSVETGPANRVVDAVADQLAGKLGSQNHQLETAELPIHSHTYDDTISASGAAGAIVGAVDEASDNTTTDIPKTTGVTGSGLAHANLQPVMAVNWYIRY